MNHLLCICLVVILGIARDSKSNDFTYKTEGANKTSDIIEYRGLKEIPHSRLKKNAYISSEVRQDRSGKPLEEILRYLRRPKILATKISNVAADNGGQKSTLQDPYGANQNMTLADIFVKEARSTSSLPSLGGQQSTLQDPGGANQNVSLADIFGKEARSTRSLLSLGGQQSTLNDPGGANQNVTLPDNISKEVTSSLPTLEDEDYSYNGTFDDKDRKDGYVKTKPEENPYAVLLVIRVGSQNGSCSGTLLSKKWVLTAAHCVKDFTLIDVFAGTTGYAEVKGGNLPSRVQKRSCKEDQLYLHPKYDPSDATKPYDVGLISVKKEFKITKYVNILPLATEPWDKVGYEKCRFTGFGRVYFGESDADDQERKSFILQVKNPCLCNYKLKLAFGKYAASKLLCSKPVEDIGICSGDSGGGLICKGKVVATAMSLIKMHDTSYCEIEMLENFSCGTSQGISNFLMVCHNLHWINEHTLLFKSSEISNQCVDNYIGQAFTPRPRFLFLFCAVTVQILVFH